MPKNIDFSWISSDEDLIKFINSHKNVEWIAFDTEFIGEKRDKTLLCLIQVQSPLGNFLIDCIQIKNIELFNSILQSPKVLKITHAGENDYKVFYELFKIVPSNVADIQIAAGFVGYKYPVSLANIMQSELKKAIDKSFTVIDWAKRPLNEHYINYALEDVIYLKEVYDRLMERIEKQGMKEWVKAEYENLTKVEMYASNPEKEALMTILQGKFNTKEKIVLYRLFKWRSEMAEKTGKQKEKVLPKKYIGALARQLKMGKKHLLSNRTLSDSYIEQNWDQLNLLIVDPPTPEENEFLESAVSENNVDSIAESRQELLLSFLRYECQLKGIDPAIVFPPATMKLIKNQKSPGLTVLETTWRYELLGKEIVDLIKFRNDITIVFEPDQIIIKWKKKN